MQENCVEPDLPIASALVSAFGAIKNSSGVRSAARSALCLNNVDGRLFVEIICAFVFCGSYKEAIEIFELSECPKNIQTCTAVMQAHIDSGSLKDAEKIYSKMKFDLSDGGYGFLPNARAHTTLLSAYEKMLMWEKAVILLRKIEHLSHISSFDEYQLNEIHYNVVLSACGKCGEWSTAEAIFFAMRARGIKTTLITFSTLMLAYGRTGEINRAHHLFMLMQNEGICPDDYSFAGLIIVYAKIKNLRAALEIKELMSLANVKETVHTYNSLIYVADVCGEYEKVVILYEMMLRKGIKPNQYTHELVVNVGKKGAKFYEETQLAASVASAAAGLVGVVGMVLGRW
jgi:pentatricopeptide repeat protein